MKLTEKILLDNYTAKSNGGDNISDINGTRIWWNYRTGTDSDGYNPVCSRDNASEITLANDRIATLPLDAECDDHESVQKIRDDGQKLWGGNV